MHSLLPISVTGYIHTYPYVMYMQIKTFTETTYPREEGDKHEVGEEPGDEEGAEEGGEEEQDLGEHKA